MTKTSAVYGQAIYIKRLIKGMSSVGGGAVALEALVVLPCGMRVAAVVKFFDPERRPKGAFNELAAYGICRKLKAPVARVVPVSCPTELLRSHFAKMQFELRSEYAFGIASIVVKEANRRTTDLRSALLERELIAWGDLAIAAVADELLLNADRTPQNLLRISEGKFVLIDHEKMILGQNWESGNISTYHRTRSPGNYLARLLLGSSNEVSQRRMFVECRRVADHLSLEINDFCPDIEGVTRAPPGTLVALIECIHARARVVAELIGQQADMDQLFYSDAIS